MLETIMNYELIVWFAVLIVFCVVSLIFMVITKIRDLRKEKDEHLSWLNYSDLKCEVAELRRELTAIQSKE